MWNAGEYSANSLFDLREIRGRRLAELLGPAARVRTRWAHATAAADHATTIHSGGEREAASVRTAASAIWIAVVVIDPAAANDGAEDAA